MNNSLLQLIKRARVRVTPMYNLHQLKSLCINTTGLLTGLLIGLISYFGAHFFGNHNSGFSVLLLSTGFFIGAVLSFIFTLGYLMFPLGLVNFKRNKSFFIRPSSLKLFKLTPSEVQELMRLELNVPQMQELEHLVNKNGYLIYTDLHKLYELEGQIPLSLKIEKTNMEDFCNENQVSFGQREVEMEWGETRPLEKWL